MQTDMAPRRLVKRAVDRAAAQTDGDEVAPRFQNVCGHGDLESPNAGGEAGLGGGHGQRLGLGSRQCGGGRQGSDAIRATSTIRQAASMLS